MNKVISIMVVVIIGFFLSVLHTEATASELSGKLVISGSDALEPLTAELAKRFMKTHSHVKIIVHSGESTTGINDTRNGNASIGMVSRALTPQEADEFPTFIIAYEGVCFITEAKNPVHDLSSAQLKEILLGKKTNWKYVGGENAPIDSFIPYRKSASNKIVADYLGVQVADLKGAEISDIEAGIKTVARDHKALFYVSTGRAFADKLNGTPINILSIDGKKANMASIARHHYPLTRALSFITRGEPDQLAKAFISFCQSPAAANVIRSHYLIKPE